ncbi:MAG: hypothetical protein NTW78_10305 [Campylobacterales bacterium]|nr:hypothetical protein [Campylobacterales bacterium]
MNKVIILLSFAALVGFIGCASQKVDNSYYDRANKVSKDTLNELDKE